MGRALAQLSLTAFRLYLRDRQALFWGFAFPVFLLGLLGLAFRGEGGLAVELGTAWTGSSYADFLLPGILALVVMQSGLFAVAGNLVAMRQRGLLKRLLATPMPPAAFLAAQAVRLLATNLAQMGLLLGTAAALFGTRPRADPLTLLLLVALGGAVFLSAGFVAAGLVRSHEASVALVSGVSMPMMFLSGVFFPRELLPPLLRAPAQLLPLSPLADALRRALLEGAGPAQLGGEIALLAAWGLLAAALGLRLFLPD